MANSASALRRGPNRRASSQYKGVRWHAQSTKWQATVTVHGRERYLGLFEIEEDAARARDAAVIELFGAEDVYLNFPDGAARPTEETHNKCYKCCKVKPLAAFSPHAGMRLGIRNLCRVCASADALRTRDANPERTLDNHLRRNFGISLAQYNAMVEAQAGLCAVCGEVPAVIGGIRSRRPGRQITPRLVVDHDHESGKIRGLLCVPCNRGIGFLRDDPALVRAALKYLEERS